MLKGNNLIFVSCRRTRVWRVFRVWAGQGGRSGGVFRLHWWLGCGWVGSGDGGFVPGAGVGSGCGEGSGLEGGALGGEVDAAAVGGECVGFPLFA